MQKNIVLMLELMKHFYLLVKIGHTRNASAFK